MGGELTGRMKSHMTRNDSRSTKSQPRYREPLLKLLSLVATAFPAFAVLLIGQFTGIALRDLRFSEFRFSSSMLNAVGIILGGIVAAVLVGHFADPIVGIVRRIALRSSPRVFISYSHKDRSVTSYIADQLKRAGAKIWIDSEKIRPGDSIGLLVRSAINAADAVIFVLPPYMTEGASKELDLAISRGIKIIPVMVHASGEVPDVIKEISYVDLRHNKQEGVRQIVQAVS